MNRTQRTLVTGLSSLALLGGGFAASSAQASSTSSTGATALADSQTCTLSTRGYSCNSATEARLRRGMIKQATFFSKTGYQGKRMTVYGKAIRPGQACTPAWDKEGQWVTFGRWSTMVASVKTYNRCDVQLQKKVNGTWRKTTWIDHSYDLRLNTKWANTATRARLT